LHRKKQGFQLPLVEWMRNDVKDQYLRVLLEPRTLQRGYFKPEAVRSLVNEHVSGRRNRSGLLWRMLVLELWHRNFMESRDRSAARQESSTGVSQDVLSTPTAAPPALGGLARQGSEI
jgi:asparagine synthetase B (glutamine-hydrolysing)